MVSRNTTLVPSLGLRIGPAREAGLSVGMRRERVPPQRIKIMIKTSQQCNTNAYCMVVLHACIHEPLVRSQPKPKIVLSATDCTEYGKPTLDLQVALSGSSK